MFTQKYKRSKVFSKDFYGMLANRKDYQPETAMFQMDKKESSFVGLVGFECPLSGG